MSADVIAAIRKWRGKGNLFGVATGRDYSSYDVFKMRDKFDFDFLILNNGAQAVDAKGQPLFTVAVENDAKSKERRLITEFVRRCLELSNTRCTLSMEHYNLHFGAESHAEKHQHIKWSQLTELNCIDRFVAAHTVCVSPEQAMHVTTVINNEFGEHLKAAQNGKHIDITAIRVDKASGILKVTEMLQVHKDNVWCVGDNYNDIGMIKSYHGVAIAGGPEEVTQAAEYVCRDVAQLIDILIGQK